MNNLNVDKPSAPNHKLLRDARTPAELDSAILQSSSEEILKNKGLIVMKRRMFSRHEEFKIELFACKTEEEIKVLCDNLSPLEKESLDSLIEKAKELTR